MTIASLILSGENLLGSFESIKFGSLSEPQELSPLPNLSSVGKAGLKQFVSHLSSVLPAPQQVSLPDKFSGQQQSREILSIFSQLQTSFSTLRTNKIAANFQESIGETLSSLVAHPLAEISTTAANSPIIAASNLMATVVESAFRNPKSKIQNPKWHHLDGFPAFDSQQLQTGEIQGTGTAGHAGIN